MGFYSNMPIASAKRAPAHITSRPRVYPEAHTLGTALHKSGARLYEPTLGRWMSRDPLEEDGGMALYVFVENNSPNAVDPDGGFSFLVQTLPPDLVPSQAAVPAPPVKRPAERVVFIKS